MRNIFPPRRTVLISLVLILLFSNIATLVWHFAQSRSITKTVAEYPYIDPARNFIPQEQFITNIEPLRKELNAISDAFGRDSVSLYVEFLNTGANISINPNKYIWPASLAKLPVAMIVMKKIERGEWKMTNELVLMQEDKDSRSGADNGRLSEYAIGTRFTIEELLEELLVNSDNTAYFILLRNIGNDEFNEFINAVGLDALFTTEGKVSAKEYARIFRALYTSSFLSRANSERLLRWLDDATFDSFLSKGVPDSVPFSHKYGEKLTFNVYADSGIVYLEGRPYLISVMTELDPLLSPNVAEQRAADFMADVSKVVYEYFATAQ